MEGREEDGKKWVGKKERIRNIGRKRGRKKNRERRTKQEDGGGGEKEKKNVGKKKIFKKNDRMKGCMYEKNERGSRIDKKKYFLQAPSPSYSLILQIPGGG